MHDKDAIEQAYKNGYNEGLLEGRKTAADDYNRGYERGKMDAVKTGKWNKIDRDKHDVWRPLWHCSLCGGQKYVVTNFCPHCGADMRGDRNAV